MDTNPYSDLPETYWYTFCGIGNSIGWAASEYGYCVQAHDEHGQVFKEYWAGNQIEVLFHFKSKDTGRIKWKLKRNFNALCAKVLEKMDQQKE